MARTLEQRVGELELIVKKLMKANKKGSVFPAGLQVGDTFELARLTWKILEITDKGYACLADELEERMKFDNSCNNWEKSKLRKYLNTEFYKQLADAVGEENILPFERDLLSMDGQTEYGICEDKVSLLTVDEYRKHRALIPNANYWWWTITPDSTKCNDDTIYVRVVSLPGSINRDFYYYCSGVRPFCIFSSAIFESEEDQVAEECKFLTEDL